MIRAGVGMGAPRKGMGKGSRDKDRGSKERW